MVRVPHTLARSFAATVAAIVVGCGPGTPAGTRAEAPDAKAPVGIVSLSPALTHTVHALGAGDRIVGRTAWCDAPRAAVVGSLEDRDLEAIVALRPALVLRQSSAPDAALEAAMRAVGGRVIGFRALDRVRDVEQAAIELAEVLESQGVSGARARAQAAVEGFHRATASPVACTRPVAFLYSTDPPAAFGEGTFVDDAWRAMGGRNAVTGRGYPTLTAEDIARMSPAAVVIVGPAEAPGWLASVAPAVARCESAELLEPSLRMLDRIPGALRAVDAELAEQGAAGGVP